MLFRHFRLCMNGTSMKRKNWVTILHLYQQEAQRRLNDDSNVRVYKREKEKLEQKYKDMNKK